MIFLFLACLNNSKFNQDNDSGELKSHPCFSESPILELGEGESQFQPFNSEKEVVMVFGPQGGWHILGSFYLKNALQILDVYFTMNHIETGALIVDQQYRLAMVQDGDCQGYYPGLYGYLEVYGIADGELDTPPELLAYDQILMKIRVNDCGTGEELEGICLKEERWIEQSIELTAIPDEVDIN